MSVLTRINLALIVALGSIGALLGYACWARVQLNAQHEVMQQAGLMLDSALAIHSYTSAEISPLLDNRMQSEFLPQAIPFYAATQNFLKLHKQHPAYSYKEAALNPTNPRDRATDWEADLIQQFRNHPETHDISGERDSPMGRVLYLARPIVVETECLVCHSTPAKAPQSLVARYGPDHGFDWQEIGSAVEQDLEEHRERGASTITQQLARNLFLSTNRSIIRKGLEFTIVPFIEWILPKRRILELYVNVVEWGPGIYGVEAASQYYFHLPASRLTRENAVELASILPSPLHRKPGSARQYQARILARMRQLGW